MASSDGVLRSSLMLLASVMLMVGIWTQSSRKVCVTYVVGMLGIVGILLPDWEFLHTDFSRWNTPVTEEDITALALRNRVSPLRLSTYIVICGYASYKWWLYVSS